MVLIHKVTTRKISSTSIARRAIGRGEKQNSEEGEMAQKSWEEGEIGGKSREEGEKEKLGVGRIELDGPG